MHAIQISQLGILGIIDANRVGASLMSSLALDRYRHWHRTSLARSSRQFAATPPPPQWRCPNRPIHCTLRRGAIQSGQYLSSRRLIFHLPTHICVFLLCSLFRVETHPPPKKNWPDLVGSHFFVFVCVCGCACVCAALYLLYWSRVNHSRRSLICRKDRIFP